MKPGFKSLPFLVALVLAWPIAGFSTPLIRSAAGSTPGDLLSSISLFQSDLGGIDNQSGGGPFTTGYRTVNWDIVPHSFSAPNNLNGNFFQTLSPHGLFVSTPGTGLQLSAAPGNPTSTALRFGNIDGSYPVEFQTFSAERLFTPIGSTVVNVDFFVPAMPTIPAYVTGFGAVFSGVDLVDSTYMEFFDLSDNSLGTVFAPAGPSGGLSFLGVSFSGEQVGRVQITSGNAALGPGVLNGDMTDLVTMDDFIYAEPQAVPESSTLALMGLGILLLGGLRLLRRR